MKPRADFEIVAEEAETVFLMDMNRGAMSITNDAEAVVAHCHRFFPGKRIVYRDTEGRWDEICHNGGMFEGFKAWRGHNPMDYDA
ncbi:hypothetical protein DVVG_00022 [Dunaliella viridis virus SI2]|uniref:hypothetical protein n=1 Tax=Dunaliella viridis virus SI2 TaxID=754069 RepID=UPI0002C14938|nr:hypothetical protein DVVG_00022 [Dunaliella viridis virus SI2]AGH16008.1 hypothetical protein DVVG_00022 [Dunaliella viridis virus SI2]